MPRISATFKYSILQLSKAYAHFNGVSFSEAVEILAGNKAVEWWGQLDVMQKEKLNKKFRPFNKSAKK